jgi:deoxyuridine 5'-triphosphate nucleotidohydrolase
MKNGEGLPFANSPLLSVPPLNCSAHDCVVPARGKAVVPTDLSIKLPPSTYGRVAPRSGLAVKNFIATGAGVVDEDYRGPLGVVLFNHSEVDFKGGLLCKEESAAN